MPRAKSLPARTERATIDHETVSSDAHAMDADAPRRAEIIEQFGDDQPFDELRVLGECRFYRDQSAAGMLEVGKRLVLLKEFTVYGRFIDLVTELGFSERTARKLMQAAVKFLLPSKGQPKLLNLAPSKLFELAVLDDDDIKELAKGKTVAGITLDEVETMGARELRDRLKEAQGELDAKDRVIEQKDKKINKLLHEDAKKLAWEHTFDATVKEISATGDALMRACAGLATLAKKIGELELEGVERDKDSLALRAQLANRYYDLSEHLLDQGVGMWISARSDNIEGLLELARKRLPDDIKAKIFKERA